MDFEHSKASLEYQAKLLDFMEHHIYPNERAYAEQMIELIDAREGTGATAEAGSDCAQDDVHALATFDASVAVKKGPRPGAIFTKLEEWRVAGRGAYADGNSPGHTLYCGHWFDPHPDWKNGGIVAIGHYDWGTRFLDVSSNGKMKEVGYFQPVAGHTSSAEWISDDIVYVHDYRRGLEILRFNGK